MSARKVLCPFIDRAFTRATSVAIASFKTIHN